MGKLYGTLYPGDGTDASNPPPPGETARPGVALAEPTTDPMRIIDRAIGVLERIPTLFDGARTAMELATRGQTTRKAEPMPQQQQTAPDGAQTAPQAPALPASGPTPQEQAHDAFMHAYEVCKYVAGQVGEETTVNDVLEHFRGVFGGKVQQAAALKAIRGKVGKENLDRPARRALLFIVPYHQPEIEAFLVDLAKLDRADVGNG